MSLTERGQAQRNNNPYAEAILAMCLWNDEYAKQRGGVMDFWDAISESRQRQCRQLVDKIVAAKRALLPRDRSESLEECGRLPGPDARMTGRTLSALPPAELGDHDVV